MSVFKDFYNGLIYFILFLFSTFLYIILIQKSIDFCNIYSLIINIINGAFLLIFLIMQCIYNWVGSYDCLNHKLRIPVLLCASLYINSFFMTIGQALDFSAYFWIVSSVTLAITLVQILFFSIWTKISKTLYSILFLSGILLLLFLNIPTMLIYSSNNYILSLLFFFISIVFSSISCLLNINKTEECFISNLPISIMNSLAILTNFIYLFLSLI